MENNLPIKFRNKISSGSHRKKCLTLTQIRALSHDIDHGTKKCHHQSATRLRKCREIPFWYALYPFWLASNWTPTQVPTFDDFWSISTCFSLQMLQFFGPKFWPHQSLVGKTSEVCFSTYFANRDQNLKEPWLEMHYLPRYQISGLWLSTTVPQSELSALQSFSLGWTLVISKLQ